MRIKKEERYKGSKAQSGKGKEKNSVPLYLCAPMLLGCGVRQNRRTSVPTKRGFTLIELMAVVAIIMILAAIIMPNVVRHMERGKEGRAAADIDVLVKAIGLFQIDHEGELPPSGSLSVLWTDSQGPYISSDQTKSLTSPWQTNYNYTSDSKSYTVQAIDKKGVVRVEKIITFSNQ